MGPAIEADRLTKRYGSEVTALDGISLDVADGALFALLGPNGAGKSTAVRILTTLALADDGSARVTGLDVRRKPGEVRRRIGVVGQGHSCDPLATGRENLRLQAGLYGIRGARARERGEEMLERLGIAGAADRLVRTYSGGMQRRLDLAMGMLHDPSVLFLDEPTTGLDPEARRSVWLEVRRVARERGTTILLTTHYLEEADEHADAVAILDRGRVVAEGTPAALKRNLRGDSIRVVLAEDPPPDLAARVADAAPGIAGVAVERRTLRARAGDGGRAAAAVLDSLNGRGVSVASITVAAPSLDDVYLSHTGREYRAAAGPG